MGASTTTIRVTTAARYRGLAVTVLGDTRAALLAIAGYGTPQELAIAAIDVKCWRGQSVYRVTGSDAWTPNMGDVARAVVEAREARDAAG